MAGVVARMAGRAQQHAVCRAAWIVIQMRQIDPLGEFDPAAAADFAARLSDEFQPEGAVIFTVKSAVFFSDGHVAAEERRGGPVRGDSDGSAGGLCADS